MNPIPKNELNLDLPPKDSKAAARAERNLVEEARVKARSVDVPRKGLELSQLLSLRGDARPQARKTGSLGRITF